MNEQSKSEPTTARWTAESSRKIVYRVVAKGQLVIETPAHFGTGDSNGTEMIILQDEIDGTPLLPGASQAGAFRHYLLRREKGYRVKDSSSGIATKLFGEALDQERGNQSRVIIYDAHAVKPKEVMLRDGVKIDSKTRTASDGALFGVQVWPEGTTFSLHLELIIYEDDKNGDAVRFLHGFAAILQALKDAEIPLGARKSRGYGRCRIREWHISEYDMSQLEHVLAWIKNEPLPNTTEEFLKQANNFVDVRQKVTLQATFALCDAIMIRSNSELVDSQHLTDVNGKPIVSGTSIAGALRARALKIAKTINLHDSDDLVDDMFGVYGGDTKKELTASRLRVQESMLLNAENSRVQDRVKIDRFTGGAYETALFSEQPAFATSETRVEIRLELQIPDTKLLDNERKRQIGLLLLLLKDLWTQDLPIGGESSIGRGRLQGCEATLTVKITEASEEYKFNQYGLLDPNQAQYLQTYVDTLRVSTGGGK